MKKTTLLLSTLSMCIVASPFMSCSDFNGDSNQYVTAKERDLSKVQLFKKNFTLIKEIFDRGVTEENLEELLALMGEKADVITIEQFNELYQQILNVDLSDITVEDMLKNDYYQNKTEGFRDAIRSIFSGEDMTDFFNSVEYSELSQEDKDVIEGMYMVRTELEGDQENDVFYGRPSEPGFKVGVSDDTAVILLYTGIGAATGGALGAGIGFVVGVIMVKVKK